MKYILILVYSTNFTMAEEKQSFTSCIQESEIRIGEKAKVTIWDSMNGSNPIPTVTIAFCVNGNIAK